MGAVPHLLGPRTRSRPRLRVGLERINAAAQEFLHDRRAPPAARPAERSTLQQFVTDVGARAGVEQRDGKRQRFFFPDPARCAVVEAHGHHVVQDGAPERTAMIGVAARENQPEALQVAAASRLPARRFDPRHIAPECLRTAQLVVPTRVVRRPVDARERHPDDLRLAAIAVEQNRRNTGR